MKIPRIPIAGLMGLVVLAALAFASLKFATQFWASVVLPLTLLTLAIGSLAAIRGARRSRGFWAGFASFGWGYLALVSGTWWDSGINPAPLGTTGLLDTIFASRQNANDPGKNPGAWLRTIPKPDLRTIAIQRALDRPITFAFAQSGTLEEAIKQVRSATAGTGLPGGIPIYVDPIGLEESGKSLDSPIRFQLAGVPIGKSLRLLLRQLDLTFRVDAGLLTITSTVSTFDAEDPDAFRRIGQCWWTLLAALIGGWAGRFLDADRRSSRSGDPAQPVGV